MKRFFYTARQTAPLCVLVLLCCLTLGGCIFGKTVIGRPGDTRPDTGGKPVTQSQISVPEAENALKSGQMARAEQIATRLISRSTLSKDEVVRTARVLAVAATANSHPYLAMTALDRWIAADAKADASEEWRHAFLTALAQLPVYDAQARARSVIANAARPFPVRSGAMLYLASQQWEKGQGAQALVNLQTFYAQAGDKKNQAQMEHALFEELHGANSMALGTLDALVNEQNSAAYPYAIVRLETLRRKALHGGTREEAKAGVAMLAENTALADPAILRAWDTEVAAQATVVPLEGKKLVLALPLTGPLSSIGKKIAQGANEARDEFKRAGHTVSVALLDTHTADWADKLAKFPPDATIVGGPLRTDVFNAARAKGLTGQRVFLTFMPTLGDNGEEGRVAWRFFPSAEDQMTALFAATSKIGVREYGILMPDKDPWAAKMADMFTAYVQAGGGRVVKRAEYPRDEPEKWNKFVGSYLGTHKRATHKPATPHQALFLPDSWRNMELIIPNLFYFLETRQLLLGTSLWEQGLASADNIPAHYYKLAIFPGAWNKTAPSRGGEQLYAAYARAGRGEPDFWAGLGYDFVRFSATLNVPPKWDAGSVNALLSGNNAMLWSMAPITWSSKGKASQNLFLFTPAKEGVEPADVPAIEEKFNKVWRR